MPDKHSYAPGMYDIPEDEYHELPYLSNSDISKVIRSPAHYYAAKLDPEREPEEPTTQMLDGRALHTAILEPELYKERFIVLPPDAPARPTPQMLKAKNPSPSSVERMQWWEAWNIQAAGRVIVDAEKQERFLKCSKAIRSNPDIKAFLDHDGYAEKSFIDVHPGTGITRRCRVDFITQIPDIGTIAIDLKTTEDARPAPFSRSCYNYGYFRQADYYCDVIEGSGAMPRPDLFLFAAFERVAPFGLKLYQATESAMLRAGLEWEKALNKVRECLDANEWPGYSTDIQSVDYPAWASPENEDD